jgi:hypothetical protein
VSLRQLPKSRDDVLLFRKHPRLFRERIPPFPRTFYVSVLTLLGSLVAVALGQPLLSIALLLVWVALTLSFMLKRLRHTSKAPSHLAEMAVTSILIPLLATYWRIRGCIRYQTLLLEGGWSSHDQMRNRERSRVE